MHPPTHIRFLSCLFSLGILSPAMVGLTPGGLVLAQPAASASTSPAAISCPQERENWADRGVLRLQEQIDHALTTQQWEPANRYIMQTLQLIRVVPTVSWRSLRLGSLVYEDPTGQKTLWQQWVDLAVAQGRSAEAAATLAETVRLTQSLNAGYSRLKVQTFVTIAHAHQALQQTTQANTALSLATQTVATVRGAEFKANALIPIAQTYIQQGELERAIVLLDQAQRQVATIPAPAPASLNNTLRNIAIAYAQANQLPTAIKITQQLASQPYVQGDAMQMIGRVYVRQGQLDEALALARRISLPELRAVALGEVAVAFAAQGNGARSQAIFTDAVEVARTVQDAESSLTSVVTAYAGVHPEMALAIAQTIQDPEKRSTALMAVALHYRSTDRVEAAIPVVEQLVQAIQQGSSDWQGFHLQDLIDQAVAVNDVDLAIRLSDLIPTTSPGDRNATLFSIARDLLARPQADAGVQVAAASKAVQAIDPNSTETKIQALKLLATAYLSASKSTEAIALLDQLAPTDQVSRTRLQAAIGRQLILTGNIDPAVVFFENARQTAQAIAVPTDRIAAWGAIVLETTIAHQSIHPADLQQLQQAVLATAPDLRTDYLNDLIYQGIAADQLEAALQIFQVAKLDDQGIQSNAFALAAAALKTNRDDVMLQAIALMTAPETQVGNLLELANRYRLNGQSGSVTTLLQRALPIARTIPDPESRELVFGSDGTTRVDDEYDRASLLEAIALQYSALGQRSEALRVARLIQSQRDRAILIQRLGCDRAS